MDSGKFLLILFVGLIVYGLFRLSVHLWNSFVDWLADTAWPRIKDWFSRGFDHIKTWWDDLWDKSWFTNLMFVFFLALTPIIMVLAPVFGGVSFAIGKLPISDRQKRLVTKISHAVLLLLLIIGTAITLYTKYAPESAPPTSHGSEIASSLSVSSSSSSSGGSVYKASATTRPTRTPTPTPTRVVYTPTPSAEDAEIIVYVTEYGSKYHRRSCGSLWNSCYEITLSKAIANGYTPCKKCNPPK